MKTVQKSVLIWYSADEMFALVTDVVQYPQFLPWCDRSRIVESDGAVVTAEIGIAFGGIRQTFTTRNTHTPGRAVDIALINGPFSRLDGHWTFAPLGGAAQTLSPLGTANDSETVAPRGCRVGLSLHYGFDNAALSTLVGPVFDKIAGSLVDAFVKRAGQVYGG